MSTTTIAKPPAIVAQELKALVQQETEAYTIVHCRYFTTEPTGVRIWPTTFLVEDSGERRKLLHLFNISLMPQWTFHFVTNEFIRFTLVFEALAKNCSSFHLLEDISQPFGFYSKPVQTNRTGVYSVEVFCD